MAYANATQTAEFGFTARFTAFKNSVAQRMARYRVYRETLVELESLTDRDLNDLGLSRAGIKAVALEAAYGN
ncbi:DUF1127 domain-containing protein [Pacificibacter marinus]|jgi:uncharacterized protein YjiS (DUF1127 family)|uniref:YjiS-like domain-containing protein n=1 Tax=Pacificibacter marinus TaxID=658057 RepID=A0A1Y5SMF9_9RHOB|nr:DUF1127 domain-containing protein [Pacificibacter marinus]SEK62293.1 protein of unknown function [Pacificibacter marinus]SLN41145.1 hypothetical protein PAM7971_01890 [Pacificibacter marinus]